MKCEEFLSLLPMYPDAIPSEREMEAFLLHAGECTTCGVQLREHEAMLSMLHVLDDEIEIPSTLTVQCLHAMKQTDTKKYFGYHQWQRGVVAIAASFLIIIGTVLMREGVLFTERFSKTANKMDTVKYMDVAGQMDITNQMYAPDDNSYGGNAREEQTQPMPMEMQQMQMAMMIADDTDAMFYAEEEAPTAKSFTNMDDIESDGLMTSMQGIGTENTAPTAGTVYLSDEGIITETIEHEQEPITEHASNAFINTLDTVYVFIKDMLIFLMFVAPYIVCIALIAFICYAIRRMKIKKVKDKRSN